VRFGDWDVQKRITRSKTRLYVDWQVARRGQVRSHIFKELLLSAFTDWMFVAVVMEALI
jgi:hypothetical protein